MKCGNMLVFFLVLGASTTTAQEVFESLKTVHFNIMYQKGITEEKAKDAADYLESDLEYLRARLGMNPKSQVDVRLYESTANYVAGAGLRKPDRGACYHTGVIHVEPISLLEEKNLLPQMLSFALADAMLADARNAGCPRWLQESFAVYHSGIMANLSPAVGFRLLLFSDLDQNIQQYPDSPQREEVDYLLGMTMQFLTEKFGEEKVLSLFARFDGMREVEDIFTEVLGSDYTVVEKAWATFMNSKILKVKKQGQ